MRRRSGGLEAGRWGWGTQETLGNNLPTDRKAFQHFNNQNGHIQSVAKPGWSTTLLLTLLPFECNHLVSSFPDVIRNWLTTVLPVAAWDNSPHPQQRGFADYSFISGKFFWVREEAAVSWLLVTCHSFLLQSWYLFTYDVPRAIRLFSVSLTKKYNQPNCVQEEKENEGVGVETETERNEGREGGGRK